MSVTRAITRPKLRRAGHAKYCSVDAKSFHEWEYFTFQGKLFSFFSVAEIGTDFLLRRFREVPCSSSLGDIWPNSAHEFPRADPVRSCWHLCLQMSVECLKMSDEHNISRVFAFLPTRIPVPVERAICKATDAGRRTGPCLGDSKCDSYATSLYSLY